MLFWARPNKTSYMATYLPSHKSPNEDMLGIAGEVTMNSKVIFSYGLLYMDTPVLADQQISTFISSVQTLDAV